MNTTFKAFKELEGFAIPERPLTKAEVFALATEKTDCPGELFLQVGVWVDLVDLLSHDEDDPSSGNFWEDKLLAKDCQGYLQDLNFSVVSHSCPPLGEPGGKVLVGVSFAYVPDFREGVTCSLCGKMASAVLAHLHDKQWIGDECCWDERLRSSE